MHIASAIKMHKRVSSISLSLKKIKKVEMATLEECSIEVFQISDCHRKEYGHNKNMIILADLDCDEQERLLWRRGLIVKNRSKHHVCLLVSP